MRIQILILASFCHLAVADEAGNRARFDQARTGAWLEIFTDPGTKLWREQWFLDGIHARVGNDAEKMTINTAGGYAVLWTKREFSGDLKIEYDFRRADDYRKQGVNIIYLQARGDGQNGHVPDITRWSERRSLAAMSDYFRNMHTYHISYATAGNDYIRARRYLPLTNQGLKGTQLDGEYTEVGLFGDKEWIHVTIIKHARELWAEFRHPDQTLLCHFRNADKPGIDRGRIGLRLMPKRESHFRNIRICEAGKPAAWQLHRGQADPTGWRAHVIQPDHGNIGPDGINLHDRDADRDLDNFVNYEAGKYSRLFFNRGHSGSLVRQHRIQTRQMRRLRDR
jgi:hypothetical protein